MGLYILPSYPSYRNHRTKNKTSRIQQRERAATPPPVKVFCNLYTCTYLYLSDLVYEDELQHPSQIYYKKKCETDQNRRRRKKMKRTNDRTNRQTSQRSNGRTDERSHQRRHVSQYCRFILQYSTYSAGDRLRSNYRQ